ncbi:hypothetical protein [Sulfurimonas sp. HSL3-7]|uniref:hypothetical protein n=1 Tax=Sulfonitrofixus jiaomeiensis TaxID=3131938 RepID=UPI0031F9F7EE
MQTNSLIDIFTDHVLNRKSLKDYVEIRKGLHERGEFNDASLIRAEEILQCLKLVDNESYELMYKTLDEIFEHDAGNAVEYPINFIREVLKIGQHGKTGRKVCEEYRRTLEHHFHGE